MRTQAKNVAVFDRVDLRRYRGSGDAQAAARDVQAFPDEQIPPGSRVTGVARESQSIADDRERVREALQNAVDDDAWGDRVEAFLEQVDYRSLDATEDAGGMNSPL